jgi:plastocyanin
VLGWGEIKLIKALYLVTVFILILGGITTAVSCGAETPITIPPGTTPEVTTPGATATVTMPEITETPIPVDNIEITIENYEYLPPLITISIGTTITWRNLDSVEHTVTDRNGAFDSSLFGRNETFSHLFTEAGEYDYYCIPHPFMTGKVIVE